MKTPRANIQRNTRWQSTIRTLCVVVPGLVAGAPTALADGTEILEPTLSDLGQLAEGSKIVGAGIGLSLAQPGNLEFEIPAAATVNQVFLYWDGADREHDGAAPTIGTTSDTVQVNGVDVTGTFIGGRYFASGTQLFTFRADITDKALVVPGSNLLSIEGVNFSATPGASVETGAGVLVVLDDGSSSTLTVYDGNDYAYINCAEGGGCTETVRRTFTFPAAGTPRDASLTLFFTSVSGEASTGGDLRPSLIEIAVPGAPTIELVNQLDSVDGEEWDTVDVELQIPAGGTQVEVQAFSEDLEMTGALPASFKWLAAALSVPDEAAGGEGCTPGYWRQDHHYDDWAAPYLPTDPFSDYFDDAFPGKTLADVVAQGGGHLNALGRHTVAALLNAANPDVSYDESPQEVVDAFNEIFPGSDSGYETLKDRFEALNEQGCPLGNSGNESSNENGNGNENAQQTSLDASARAGGGGALGLLELLMLTVFGWSARFRTRRQN
jgi:hypothetical protein